MNNIQEKQLEENITNLFENFKQNGKEDLSIAWNIGEILRKYLQHITNEKEGQRIIQSVVDGVSKRFLKLSKKKIYEYIDFASAFPDIIFVQKLPKFIDWSFIKFLLTITDENKRSYYLTLAIHYNWNLNELKKRCEEVQGKFRPCIDLHDGKVKQIVGGSLTEDKTNLKTNFISEKKSSWYANLYRQDNLFGGHIIMLGSGNEEACIEALRAYPQAMQVGGGININNALKYLDEGATHIIVTSYLFNKNKLDLDALTNLVNKIGKNRIVIDLSCKLVDSKYYVFSNRWQTKTDLIINKENLFKLSEYCDEFLVHAINNEGLCNGIDYDLVSMLTDSPLPVTYAGGANSIDDLHKIREVGKGKIDLTIGSALDIFGGSLIKYKDAVTFNNSVL